MRVQHAIAGALGAILTLALGIVPLDLVALALRLLFFPVVTIVSLMVITLVAERAGLFDLLARSVAAGARGDGRRLFSYLFACGTVTGMFFTNDAAVLIFTPLVFRLVEQIQDESWTLENKIPYYFAVLYVANLVGSLVTSNPINIVVASLFRISFAEYARWMFVPALASILVTFAGLQLFFRRTIPRSYTLPPVHGSPAARGHVARDSRRRQLVACVLVLSATLAGFFTQGWTGLPTWLVAFAGAAILLGVDATVGKGDPIRVLRGVSWDVLAFVVGIFIVVLGLRHAGLTSAVGAALMDLARRGTSAMTFGTGFLAALFSSIMNNHPTAYMMGWAIRDLPLPAAQAKTLAFAALIGGDLGPKMLPIGSLAALIWFRLLRKRGVQIPYSLYVRIGIPVTLAAIAISVLVLNAELAVAAGH